MFSNRDLGKCGLDHVLVLVYNDPCHLFSVCELGEPILTNSSEIDPLESLASSDSIRVLVAHL